LLCGYKFKNRYSQSQRRLPATVASAATTTTAAVATTAATGAILFRLGFIDIQRPAIQVAAVQTGDGILSLTVVAHFHESKTTGPSGVPIGNEVNTVNRTERFKHRSDGAFSSVKTEISYENILHLNFFLEFAEQRTRAGQPEKPVNSRGLNWRD
jgi:hypothetical protein